MNWVKIIFWGLVVLVIFLAGFNCGRSRSDTIVVREVDTLTVPVHDTVIKWYERIVYKESPPETIIVYDTLVLIDTLWPDLEEGTTPANVVHAEAAPGKLILTCMKYRFDSSGTVYAKLWRQKHKVHDSYTIIAQKDRIWVKTRRALWLSAEPGVGVDYQGRISPFVLGEIRYSGLALTAVLGPQQASVILGWKLQTAF